MALPVSCDPADLHEALERADAAPGDPAAVGRAVLEGLRKGRELAIERARAAAAPRRREIRRLLDDDILRGGIDRGRPVRIASRLPGHLRCDVSTVRRILRALYSPHDPAP
jgi:hypothetical protein